MARLFSTIKIRIASMLVILSVVLCSSLAFTEVASAHEPYEPYIPPPCSKAYEYQWYYDPYTNGCYMCMYISYANGGVGWSWYFIDCPSCSAEEEEEKKAEPEKQILPPRKEKTEGELSQAC